MGQPYAAGSLYSTVLDLYKWDRALYTTKVLSARSIEVAFTENKHDWAAVSSTATAGASRKYMATRR
jgi:hypothetical protein